MLALVKNTFFIFDVLYFGPGYRAPVQPAEQGIKNFQI